MDQNFTSTRWSLLILRLPITIMTTIVIGDDNSDEDCDDSELVAVVVIIIMALAMTTMMISPLNSALRLDIWTEWVVHESRLHSQPSLCHSQLPSPARLPLLVSSSWYIYNILQLQSWYFMHNIRKQSVFFRYKEGVRLLDSGFGRFYVFINIMIEVMKCKVWYENLMVCFPVFFCITFVYFLPPPAKCVIARYNVPVGKKLI